MSRVYTASFQAVAISAAQDLLYLLCSSTMPIEIHSVTLSQKTLTAWEGKDFTFRRLSATVTAGSGGATVTPTPHAPNDAAAVTTARRNDTTVATTSGANTIIKPFNWLFLNEFYWSPAGYDDRIIVAPSTAFVIRLDTAPSAAMTASGEVTFAELV
jgi:hypothetical protein